MRPQSSIPPQFALSPFRRVRFASRRYSINLPGVTFLPMHHAPRLEDHFLTRRDFLQRCGIGFGAVGLATLLGQQSRSGESGLRLDNPLKPRAAHFPGRAKRVIHIFANGGPSQVDTFDPKPALDKWHGKPIPLELKTERKTGAAYRSPFKFQKYGQSG